MPIDLHAHTTASDGSFSPRELVSHAKELGLRAVAITDHDTFSGHEEALAAGAEMGVEIVPGIELSVQGPLGKFHLLGFYCDFDSRLGEELRAIQHERLTRGERVINELREKHGFQTSVEAVREIAGEGAQIGRPHIARSILGQRGLETIQQVFDEWLDNPARLNTSKRVLDPQIAVELIHEAGGVAVWAHPLVSPSERGTRGDYGQIEPILQAWRGLDGIEIYYGQYSREDAEWIAQLAQKYGLLGTGGSDFHGITKPDVFLGQVNGGQSVPDSVLDELKALAHKRNASRG